VDGHEEEAVEAQRSVEAAHASTNWWAVIIGRKMQGRSTVRVATAGASWREASTRIFSRHLTHLEVGGSMLG